MITAGTYLKHPYFQTEEALSFLHDTLLSIASAFNWELHAWAVFSNHYHFVARSPADPSNLKTFLGKLHQMTASKINQRDNTPNRQVWYQFWDSRITIHSSYLARLNYVHQNAVKHGLVAVASNYPWCSAFQFEKAANRSFVKSVYRFDYNKVNVFDEY